MASEVARVARRIEEAKETKHLGNYNIVSYDFCNGEINKAPLF